MFLSIEKLYLEPITPQLIAQTIAPSVRDVLCKIRIYMVEIGQKALYIEFESRVSEPVL